MQFRLLYRWKSFWLGVFVLCFIAWAGWHSTRFCSQGNIGRVIIQNHGRAVSVAPMPPTAPYRSYWGLIPFAGLRRNLEVPAFPRVALCRGHGTAGSVFEERARRQKFEPLDYWTLRHFVVDLGPLDYWFLVIPHWLLLIVVALPWTAFLAWRWRRMRRAAAPPLD